ncbi:GNAT family N-acetyltransferase [Dongshaea marina]|uniref:GNAT family N-acetyltransferase n=1 Tax=Dongshaea marina TaxID=2047966 RepID=UPI000D3E3A0B|nr:GNAT family N-acetyltransferase [Dongshaea marina]
MAKPIPVEIRTKRTLIRVLAPEQAILRQRYFIENQRHLSPWEPRKPPQAMNLGFWTQFLLNTNQQYAEGSLLPLTALTPDESQVIATCNFSNIVYGVFQACHLGYSVAASHQGKGIMYEVATAAIEYLFERYQLHRIMANYIPTNQRSAVLLKRLGFVKEGYAKSYLKINGRWQDHVLTSLINPAHKS